MPRTLNATLLAALDAGNYAKPIIRGYIGTENSKELEVIVISYTLRRTSIQAKIYSPNALELGDTLVYEDFTLERGLEVGGTEYTVFSLNYQIKNATRNFKFYTITADIGNDNYFSTPGDVSYATAIETWFNNLTNSGYTNTFQDTGAAWLDYQFLPDGKSIILNRNTQFLNMLAQKYFIYVADNANNVPLCFSVDDVFRRADDWTIPVTHKDKFTLKTTNRVLRWVDENGTYHLSAVSTPAVHNLGYLESTDDPPVATPTLPTTIARQLGSPVVTLPFHLKYLSGDHVIFTHDGLEIDGVLDVVEILQPDSEIPWRIELTNLDYLTNTEGGAMPSTIERVSNYTPLNVSGFDGVLSANDNNVQAAMDTLDDHSHVIGTEEIEDIIGAMVTGNSESGVTGTYNDTTGKIDFELITEYIEDLVGNMVSGAGVGAIIVVYNDTTGQLEFSFSNEAVQDVVGAMLSGNTENNIEVTYQDDDGTIDFNTIFLFPLATYTDLNPINASNKFPYAGTIEASMSLVKWSMSIFTATSHTGSAYYTIELKLRQSVPGSDVTLATIDTKTIVGGQQTTLSTTTFSQAISGTGYLYIQCTKTGTPTDIYITCPALRAKLT